MQFNLEELKELKEQMKRMGIDTIPKLIDTLKPIEDTFCIEENHKINYAEFCKSGMIYIEAKKGYAIEFEDVLIGDWIEFKIVKTQLTKD